MNEKPSNHLSCSRATEWLHLLLDTELSSADHEKLIAHLQTCERCSAAYGELSMIEAAHAKLDARISDAPKDYFTPLPQKIMARIAEVDTGHAKPRIVKLPSRSFDVRAFIFGRGKYALAFAAILALAFLLTRQLREQVPSVSMTKDVIPPVSPSISQAEPSTTETQIAEMASSAAGGTQPSAIAESLAAPSMVTTNLDTNSMDLKLALAAASASEEGEFARNAEQQPDTTQVSFQSESTLVNILSDTAAPMQSLLAGAPQVANEAPELQTERIAKAQLEAVTPPSAPLSRSSNVSKLSVAYPPVSESESSLGVMGPAAKDPRLAQVLNASAQAPTQAERLKIWQDYFAYSQRDSASYAAAVETLARRLLSQSDSSNSVTQMQETLSFYQTMETVLAARWGHAAYQGEKARLEGLLNWKRAAQP